MPRTGRQRSSSGIYHIILRGANRQEIFHDDEDKCRFLDTLERYKSETEIKVYAWCLMGNHVHLLLHEGNEQIGVTMKRIGVSYASYYNTKYKATGHLFQGRYKSENIENNRQLIAVTRYIHRNPVKAKIVNRVSDWRWSSCDGYYGNQIYPPFLLDNNVVLNIFSKDKNTAIKKFIEYNEIINQDKYLDDDVKIKLTDEEAREKMKEIIKEYEIPNIKSLPKSDRDSIIAKIKEIEGLTQRQISRILGVSLSLVNRA